MKFSELLSEFIDLKIDESHHQSTHQMSFNMLEQRSARIKYLEEQIDNFYGEEK